MLLFPLATAAFYVVTSIAGGHTGDEKGDLVLVLPLAGAAFVIACVFVFSMLFPAMLVCDGVRFVSGTPRWKTLLFGLIIVSLLYLPWQLTAPDGFTAKWYLVGTAIVGVVFTVYWSVCQVVDVIAEKLIVWLRKRI